MPQTDAFTQHLRRYRLEQEREMKRTMLAEEAARWSQSSTIQWLADYERGADARRAAWEASPFYCGFSILFRRPAQILHERCTDAVH
jgi:hypothetical protein